MKSGPGILEPRTYRRLKSGRTAGALSASMNGANEGQRSRRAVQRAIRMLGIECSASGLLYQPSSTLKFSQNVRNRYTSSSRFDSIQMRPLSR